MEWLSQGNYPYLEKFKELSCPNKVVVIHIIPNKSYGYLPNSPGKETFILLNAQ
jgi:hypothetical protein